MIAATQDPETGIYIPNLTRHAQIVSQVKANSWDGYTLDNVWTDIDIAIDFRRRRLGITYQQCDPDPSNYLSFIVQGTS